MENVTLVRRIEEAKPLKLKDPGALNAEQACALSRENLTAMYWAEIAHGKREPKKPFQWAGYFHGVRCATVTFVRGTGYVTYARCMPVVGQPFKKRVTAQEEALRESLAPAMAVQALFEGLSVMAARAAFTAEDSAKAIEASQAKILAFNALHSAEFRGEYRTDRRKKRRLKEGAIENGIEDTLIAALDGDDE